METRILLNFFIQICLSHSKFFIDWSKCDGTDRVCLVTAASGTLNYYTADQTNERKSGVQIRPYNKLKWLVLLQKVDNTDKVDPTIGLNIFYGGKAKFGCHQPTGKSIVFTADPPMTAVAYESYSRFKGKTAICSFILTAENEENLQYNVTETNLKFEYKLLTSPQSTSLEHEDTVDLFEKVALTLTCDPAVITFDPSKPIAGFDGFVKHEIRDIARKILNCSRNYQLMVTPKDKNSVEVAAIECSSDKTYKYKSKTGTESKLAIDDEAFCAVPISDACKDPSLPGVIFQYPSKIICPDDKWFINGNLYTIGQSVCKTVAPNEGGWFIRTMNNKEFRMNTAQCYEKIDCTIYSTLHYVCPLSLCSPFTQSKESITCPANHLLRVVQPSGRVLQLSQLVCSGPSGRWKDVVMPEEVENGASAYCEMDCNAVSPVQENCPDSKECTGIFRIDQQIRCPAAYSLRVVSGQKKLSPERLKCNINNGRWMAANDEIAAGATAYCEADRMAAAPSVAATLALPLAVSTFIPLAVVAAMVALFVYQRRKNTKEAEEAIEEKRGRGISAIEEDGGA